MTTSLHRLVKQAVALADDSLCADGHDWQIVGERLCLYGYEGSGCKEVMPRFECDRCGAVDHGKKDSVGFNHCKNNCPGFVGHIGK